MLPDEITVNFKFRPKLLLVSPLVLLVFMAAYSLPWGAASAPAWVQALGSIAAILAAMWISHREDRERFKLQRTERIDRAKRLSIILNRFVTEVFRAGDAQDDPIGLINGRILDGLRQGVRVIQQVDLTFIPSGDLLGKWLAMRLILQDMESDYEKLNDPKSDIPTRETSRWALQANKDHFIRKLKEFSDLVEKYQGG